MSHTARVEVDVKDLSSLREACRRLGLEFVEGQQTYKVHAADGSQSCDHAIRIPRGHPAWREDSYEVGVIKNKPGTFRAVTLADGRKVKRDVSNAYSLSWDSYLGGNGLRDVVGAGCKTLIQNYATVTAMRAAKAKGFRVVEQKLANGSVQLRCTK